MVVSASDGCAVFLARSLQPGDIAMKRIGLFFTAVTVFLVSLHVEAGEFTLNSPDFSAGQPIPKTFVYNSSGCTGKNISPALNWSGAPAGTKSFVLTVYDPDAPTGSGWWHWVVADIPASTHHLARGAGAADSKSLPGPAIQLRNDFGVRAYGGPCPPKGDAPHHYQIKVYALDVPRLHLTAQDSPAKLGFMVHQHRLGMAELVGRYGRSTK